MSPATPIVGVLVAYGACMFLAGMNLGLRHKADAGGTMVAARGLLPPAPEDLPMPTTEGDLLYNRRATVVRVLDGDTVDFEVDLGFGFSMRSSGQFHLGRFRLYGINAPETRRPAGMPDDAWVIEKAAGEKAKMRLAELLPMGKTIYLQSKKPDKYGRFLGICWTSFADFGDEAKSVNALLLGEKLAKANSYGDEPLKVGG